TAAGAPNASFGAGGVAVTDFAGGDDTAAGVALQADGKLVVGGSSLDGRFGFLALARYNTDGSLDTSFADAPDAFHPACPIATAVGPIDAQGRALVIQPNGRIVLAGRTARSEADPTTGDFVLARYDVNGRPDTNFGLGGQVVTDVSAAGAGALGLAATDNGK